MLFSLKNAQFSFQILTRRTEKVSSTDSSFCTSELPEAIKAAIKRVNCNRTKPKGLLQAPLGISVPFFYVQDTKEPIRHWSRDCFRLCELPAGVGPEFGGNLSSAE